jgi:acyl transferase domain-containing protein/acyl carrier protein/NADP-dependent 3-hydroxy acid dehydrogenase YdfG/1,4-dihydroxy-2-naphthoyl-CoA synthase
MNAPIAIIGIGLRLPQAHDLDGFWDHLAAARSLISEVPARRWDKEQWRGNPTRDNKTNSIWGGFIEDADCFDAAFFNISPREAAWMDPQQRFALELAWHAIEDSGTRAEALAGSRTGVFMGVCHWDYAELLEKHLAQLDAYTPTGIAFSIIANRVSHFFDFHGPSVTNDTACAASLTSVHDAVRALHNGDCDLALAGGVNLIWSPNHFVAFSKAGMLSKTGRAKAFDADADGYVRGEGGAMLLLKPLAQAIADGDPIHAVIRGVGINHGGRTNSLTVTNPKAQAALIAEVHQGAGIAPNSVSYIEAHGPGTPLGDPIEIAGLKQAFAQLHAWAGTEPLPKSCGIGSVKTNIGHLEGAAGVAGMVKVLAALRHGLLPANVGFERLNSLIDLAGTPFRIQAETTAWPRDPAAPRRAAVSSFGFGGSNAHVVLEDAPVPAAAAAQTGPQVLPLSAKDDERLTASAAALLAFAQRHAGNVDLAELAHTLQSGREAMEARLAVVAESWDDLAAALGAAVAGQDHPALCRSGTALPSSSPAWMTAAAWVADGKDIWSELWADQPKPRRIHAPLYPFARERHWMDESLGGKDESAVSHPLLQRNLSDFAGIHYQTRLKGPEFFWADHHVGGVQVLPGMVSLEMARAAVERALGQPTALTFENVVWTRPIRAGDGAVTVDLRLTRQSDDAIAFTIQEAGAASVANCQGVLRSGPIAAPPQADLAALRAAAPNQLKPEDCYARLRASGVAHGPAFQALTQIHSGDGQVIAQLKLARRLHPTLASMLMHPVMLDAAIQAWVGLSKDAITGAAVPFACRRIEVLGPCEPVMWARVRPASDPGNASLRRLDIDLLDKDGHPRVIFHDLALRVMTLTDAAAPTPIAPDEVEAPFLSIGQWRPMPLTAPRPTAPQSLVVLAGLDAELSGPTLRLPPPDADDLPATVTAWYAALHRQLAETLRAKPRQQILVLAPDTLPPCLTQPLAALLKTAAIEQPKLDGAVIRIAGPVTAERLAAIIAAERLRADTWPELRYDEHDRRLAWVPEETTLPPAVPSLDPAGVYWITGGLGGLGQIFARWLIEHGARHVVLSGRRAINADDPRLVALRTDGVEIRYAVCDIADRAAVERFVHDIGPLKGIIHAAGILDDGFILARAAAAEAAVLAPKVAGTVNLDWATRATALDFMVLCSSVAAVFGNAGQAGYGAANAFMDAFADQRTALTAQGARHGITRAIAWPLWAAGGMGVDAATLASLHRHFGTVPMPSPTGLAALDRILAAEAPSRVTVLHGEPERLRRMLSEFGLAADTGEDAAPVAVDSSLTARAQDFVRDILTDVLHLETGRIRTNRKLDEYGLDSIAIVEATNRLEEALGPLSKTLFFEYVDLAGIAAHLVEEHGPALAKILAESSPAPAPTAAAPARIAAEVLREAPQDDRDSHDIAIIGLSLQVAKAADQKTFWHMLANGLHGFEPYPASRWNHDAILHPERDVRGKTVVRTGAFLDDIAAFDPRYFRISQYEAELMSPEVRLFLQASVEAFEDAGYSRESMQTRYGGDVAVIVGSMTNEYDLYGFQNMLMRGALASGSYTGTVPNMVSYFYGFTGPSYFLDTMCSASSTCVHEAVHMLRAGRCKMALAGGISLLLHPQKLIATSQEHFTTKTAEVIRGYGLGADGTILGEGVGALALKTLADAKRDGDHIYGVIRGTAISNAGIRNGFTVPNPHQQTAAIERALDDAGVDARSIGYIEGHGSGTALGDPIEIKALTQAFRKHTADAQFCPIGTVKSNIAHLLAASGLAGIAKVLMQMEHGQLAPSLHADTLNPNIAFERTPFYVQRELAPWPRLHDAAGAEIPRRAGVTSIGAGGMNSHIVIEEFIAPPPPAAPTEPQLLVFSAMNEAALATVIQRFLGHLDEHPGQDLADLAYTLQVGRNELQCRLALVAADRTSVIERLRAFAAAGVAPYYTRSILDHDPDTAGLDDALASRDLERIAAAWVTGAAIDWERLHQSRRPHRLSLPAYPFERVRCWYPEFADAPSVINPLGSKLKLHPFVGVNRSDLNGLRFGTTIHLGELLDFTFKDGGTPTLLPTMVVETVAALARIAGLEGPLSIAALSVHHDVAWSQVTELTARLEPAADGLTVRIDADDNPWAEALVTSGTVLLPTPSLTGGRLVDSAEIYTGLRQRGLDFQPYLEVIEQARLLPGGGVLCDLRADPPQQDHFKSRMQLSAAALGAAFQALLLAAPDQAGAILASVEQVQLSKPGAIAQVLTQPNGDGAFALWFLDETGTALAHMAGIRLVRTAGLASTTPSVETEAGDPQTQLGLELRAIAASLLKFPAEQVGLREAFHDLGFDSISLTHLADSIATRYGIALSPAVFFECEHLEALSAHLIARHHVAPSPAAARRPAQAARSPVPTLRAAPPSKPPRDGIAIIGMAGRFPGSPDVESFFDHLLAGDDLTGPLPLDRYGPAYAERMTQAGFAKHGGFLTEIDRFDAAFFHISPVEAERMDPQQRLMLETAWRTVENAGYAPADLPADTGVFAGASSLDYALLLRDHGIACDGYVATGNSLAMMANRLSHVLNLHGPSETVDTACSSSLVALLHAAEALRHHRCGAALVGGVNLTLAVEGFEGPHQAGMLSPEGRCKTFGATADGYGRGEGVAAVLLKRLSDAERDGDRILGVLIGGAENHGGRAGSLTAPSVNAQAALIQTAMAGIDPASISYIEAHGTGTSLGDPVEVNGLRRAYAALMGSDTVPRPFIGLGAVKSNIGHLEAAAGLAGLVKILMAMARGTLPASLHSAELNPHLELAGSPFRLLRHSEAWPADPAHPRRAGLSSFGFGGTNAHVIVEDYTPAAPPRRPPLPPSAFAATRFWLPGTETAAAVIVTPGWRDAPLTATGRRFSRRLVIGGEIAIAPGFDAEMIAAPAHSGDLAARYGAMAQTLLDSLRGILGKSDVLLQLVVPLGDERQVYAGLSGLLDTAALEAAGLTVQVVEIEAGLTAETLARLLADEAAGTVEARVRYLKGRRLVRQWTELTSAEPSAPLWRPRGITLITGGMGALGRMIACDIARTVPGAVLVLTGTAAENADRAAFLDDLRSLGAVAVYRRVDVSQPAAVAALVRDIVEVHGTLNAIVHCAGVLRDGLIQHKTGAELSAVLAPKVAGTLALIHACADVTLDALVLFSSLSGAVGNAGQADYAAANGFMDALAEWKGLPVVAIDWPLWADGGMRADDATQAALFRRMGQRPLPSNQGLAALRRILAAKLSHAAVMAGDTARIRAFFAAAQGPAVVIAQTPPANDGRLAERVGVQLRDLFARIGGFAPVSIQANTPLEEYGIDSLMITRLNAGLSDVVGALPKTLFFEHRTLAELAGRLVRDHAKACRTWTGVKDAPAAVAVAALAPRPAPVLAAEPIAIIGIAGRYPGAADLDGFWANLAAGTDSVTEIPAERWSLDGFFHPDRDEAVARGLSYAKWGAFLDGFADFDPLFFKIAPRDAAAMDPQERLFLMSAWEAFEDSGYTRARLSASKVGVFVGVTKTGFALHGPFLGEGGAVVRPMTSFAGVANRVSHALNLSGPSLPIDTMCSSSLTAIHEACEHLRSGAVSMALAGGVNLYLHPSNFIDLSAARMLSPDGRCRSFGKGANGFVPGEGVGCVVLKPLSRALADGDRIHAVIRATAINHGGHTNGYTVPNPAAQRDLVREALQQAGLTARAVTYIEAHGTGTELGDPIELAGLTQAFAADTAERGFCALGSVKSNIGHLEAAAGIAGLTKIVLAMKHRQLAPTLHAGEANPNLDLDTSPFVLQQSLGPWPQGPRIAGLSSFGAGGANAHVIVEEWPAPRAEAAPSSATPQTVVLSARDPDRLRLQVQRLLAVLDTPAADLTSGLRQDLAHVLDVAPEQVEASEPFDSLGLDPAQHLALRRRIETRLGRAIDPARFAHLTTLDQIAAHLGAVPVSAPAPALADLAYTLQIGREAMEQRLALVAESIPALIDALRGWLNGRVVPGLYAGRMGEQQDVLSLLGDDETALREVVAHWWDQGRLEKILGLWVKGLTVDWAALPRATRPAIVTLPAYPFEQRRFWLPAGDPLFAAIATPRGDTALQAESDQLDRHIAAILSASLRSLPETTPALARWRQAAEDLLSGTATANEADPWAAWESYRRNGGPAAQMALAETTLRALPDILSGRRPATAVMFPDGAMGLVEAVYKDNPVAARFSRTLAQAAAAFLRGSPRPSLRILEIGAGTGGTSEPVFEALVPYQDRVAEYRYTDLSRAFLIHAERRYGPQWPQLATALFNVEKPLAGQDVTPGGYDLVIAANVLHATADITRTMGHVRELLAPGGLLLINETSMATLFTHVTFGLLDGWWRFTDPALRIPGTPSLTPESWRSVLASVGLGWVAGSGTAECALGQQLIAASAPAGGPTHAAAVPPPILRPAAAPLPQTDGSLRARLLTLVGETLNVAPASIALDRSFADYGLDSILGADLVHRIRRALKVELDHTQLFDFTTVARLEAFLAKQCPAQPAALPRPAVVSEAVAAVPPTREPIAIVGVSGRFAKSPDVDALWSHLLAGDDLIEPVSRFDLAPFYKDAAPDSYGRHGSFIDSVAQFDPVFFGISGLEATYMDPQQRLFLEEAWKTLENAGHAGDDMTGRRCGVFVGCSSGDYQELFRSQPPGQAFWGNTSSLIPARIAYFLDFKGPAVAVDTACSSSLVALHMACQSLWSGESEMALAGGVFTQSTARFYRYANQANMLSPSGRCAAFGAGADGIVPGEAVGAVLLRPLSAALADGDTIHAVIVASGVNQDGATNGITAPSAASQERLIRETYDRFGIDPASIGLVEAHGTGTVLGDPIEHAALARAFAGGAAKSCVLGSVKSNIGHATTAAGIAGLIKAVLSLRHATLPPTLHFNGGNPAIRFENGPFHVNSQPQAWPAVPGARRRAAVSSFGFSGTNAHAVIEEAPASPPRQDDGSGPHLFVLSARTAAQLRQQAENLARHLKATPTLNAADVAFTLLAGRRHLAQRLTVIAADLPDLTMRLTRWLADDAACGVETAELADTHGGISAEATTDLNRLADLYRQGARLSAEALFPGERRRVPLPSYPFAATRYWVDAPAAPAPKAPLDKPKTLPLRLADPARMTGPFVAQPTAGRVRLAPLHSAPPTGAVSRRPDAEGVRHLTLSGQWSAALERQLAEELRAVDDSIRAVVISGAEGWNGAGDSAALPACPVPVIAALAAPASGPGLTAALSADFVVLAEGVKYDGQRPGMLRAAAAEVEAAALALARQIVQAPRLALVELKQTMRRPDRLPRQNAPDWDALWVEAQATPPVAATARRLPLTTACMTLEAHDDGVMLLRMTEHQHKNSFTDIFMDGLSEAFAAIADQAAAKVVVLTGFDGYFACGGTRDGLQALQQGATRFTDRKIYSLPLDCPLPVIAAMQGHAIGAGWSLGMFCDRALFAAEGVYHSNYLWYGFTPGAGATLSFPLRLGDDLGREVLFTAHEYRGRDLAGRSETLRVLPAAQVLPAALALAHGLARQPRERLIALKAQANRPIAERLDGVFAEELAMHDKTFIGNPRVQERIEQMFPSAPAAPAPAPVAKADPAPLRRLVVDSLAEDLMIAASDIRDGAGFLELGLDSILAVTWIRRLNTLLGVTLPATAVYAHPTVGALIGHLSGLTQSQTPEPPPAMAAPIPAAPVAAAPAPARSNRDALRRQLVDSLAEDLMIPAADIRDSAGFLELGLDSILAVTWIRRLNGLFGVTLPATAVYAHPTVGSLVDHLAGLMPAAPIVQAPPPPPVVPIPTPAPAIAKPSPAPRATRTARSAADAVAIIGASGRFPKSPDLDVFWDNIRAGRDCITEVPRERWDVATYFHPDPLHPGTSYCRWMGAIDDVDRFDAPFFNITPLEAELMDPQQRLFLQHAWQAFEDAALDPTALAGSRCGVFVGSGPSGYGNLIEDRNAYSLLGCSGSILAARIAHLLDLRGPCISLDTACSSSLVAIAEACNSLLVGDSDLALAGGVCVLIGPSMFIDTSKVGMLSPDGHCHTFDQRANGFVPGEGAGVLLLKRLEDAKRDHDPIHAVIRGWGINQDGRTNGITAPNPQAQTRLMKEVHGRFGILPASIGLIEAHGTGTPLGDPIEIEGLSDAFAGLGDRPGTCALGSVKSNMGHLLAAAGVAGALKAMLAVEHAELPPTIQFETMNEHISLSGTPFVVNTTLRSWPQPASGPRRAAVSAFGFSGTNAHLVIESHERPAPIQRPGPWIFTLSARSRDRLADYAGAMERVIAADKAIDLGELAHTLQVGRKAHGTRLAFVFHDRDSLLRALASVVAGQPLAGVHLSQGEPDAVALFEQDDARALAASWLASGNAAKLDKVAGLWAKGLTIDWRVGPTGQRLHLPSAPFARDRHWVTPKPQPETPRKPTNGGDQLDLGLLELARAAVERSSGRAVLGLKQLLWGKPPRENATLKVVIDRDGEGLLYHVAADGADATPCHLGAVPEATETLFRPDPLSPDCLRSGSDVTDTFRRFAPNAAQTRAVWRQGEVLTAHLVRSGASMGFDPLVLEAVWQLVAFRADETEPLPVPLAMNTAWTAGPLPDSLLVRVWTRPAADTLTIALFDDRGTVCLCLDGVRLAQPAELSEIHIAEETVP